jgi:hypothetical protein
MTLSSFGKCSARRFASGMFERRRESIKGLPRKMLVVGRASFAIAGWAVVKRFAVGDGTGLEGAIERGAVGEQDVEDLLIVLSDGMV